VQQVHDAAGGGQPARRRPPTLVQPQPAVVRQKVRGKQGGGGHRGRPSHLHAIATSIPRRIATQPPPPPSPSPAKRRTACSDLATPDTATATAAVATSAAAPPAAAHSHEGAAMA
jgi:hypothetical protein